MNPEKEFKKLLAESKGELVRQKKHRVYRFPDRRIFVTSQTPSDYRAPMKVLRDFKKFLKAGETAQACSQ